MKIFLGIVDPEENLNVAFNFGRNLAEEITFDTPIVAVTDKPFGARCESQNGWHFTRRYYELKGRLKCCGGLPCR